LKIEFELNREVRRVDVEPSQSLADLLRDTMGLTGTHLGCEQGVCGACSVLVDGVAVRSCLMLGVQADGREVVTVEGLAAEPDTKHLAEVFVRNRAFQCGFCTSGMVVTLAATLRSGVAVTRDEMAHTLSGNICRCTGYSPILDAACEALGKTGQLKSEGR